MYVKLAFAVAAHLDSEIMVMDEVLAVGDMKFQQKCLGKMDDAANTEGRTVLYVSHNMNTILFFLELFYRHLTSIRNLFIVRLQYFLADNFRYEETSRLIGQSIFLEKRR